MAQFHDEISEIGWGNEDWWTDSRRCDSSVPEKLALFLLQYERSPLGETWKDKNTGPATNFLLFKASNKTMNPWGSLLIILGAWLVLVFAVLQDIHSSAVSAFATFSVPRRPGPSLWAAGVFLKATSEKDAAEEAERLKEQARLLRKEIESFQKKKDLLEEEERREILAELNAKQAWIDQYSAVVPILKPDGSTVEEKVQFPPRLERNESSILVLESSLPLGLILGEHETIPGMTTVDEVAEGSNGQASGFRVGDLVRACTACRIEMETPTWQLMAGGIGRPKTMRFMFSTDDKPFEQVMEALGSNRLDPLGRSIVVVVERRTKD